MNNAADDNGFFARGSSSWTSVIPRTAHNDIFLNADYASTSLGPIADWGYALRLYASMALSDNRGAIVYWGPEKVAFYNAKAVECLQGVHPFLMGRSYYEAFPELSQSLAPQLEHAAANGETVEMDNILLFLERNGYPEEAYFVGQFIPIRGDSGTVEGWYNTVTESTAQVLFERRRRVVDRIAAIPPLPVTETLSMFVDALRLNPHDITAALLYSFDELAAEGAANLHLHGSIGIPESHRIAPSEAHLETGQNGLVPWFRRVLLTGKPHVLKTTEPDLQELCHGITWCGYGESSRDLVICPLAISGNVLGFLVQGANPRRPYDETMENSIVDATRQMEVKWINAIAAQQAKLRELVLEQRATDSESRLRHMAHHAPMGMCQIGTDHRIQFANDQFYEITGHDRSKPDLSEFRKSLAADERDRSLQTAEGLLSGDTRIVQEIRLERRWTPPVEEHSDASSINAWMQVIAFPLVEEGKPKLLMAYVSDISHQKWAEDVQTRTAAAATLAKRRQEEFIDVTSHEMRNPLSAMTQLADGIARSLHATPGNEPAVWRDVVQENAAAASTILACAAHQKRIIDDVLMLSRLESHMLSIAPVAGQPSKVVADTIRMFDGEAEMTGTKIEVVKEESHGKWAVDWMLLDTSRLTQILINLISNAVKFTASQPERNIKVVFGQLPRRPQKLDTPFGDVDWIPPKDLGRSNTALPELKRDEDELYLYFYVQDTGLGVTPDQRSRLFKRFSQATAKTHIAYGGSGLGLYICRELAEKQGGAVGVASQSGQGSAFAFYIETRAAPAPAHSPPRTSSSKLGLPPDGHAAAAGLQSAAQLRPPGGGGGAARQLRQGLHILLVEDNLVNQRVLAKQLRTRAKCTVTVANHGAEALGILAQTARWRGGGGDRNPPQAPGDHRAEPTMMTMTMMPRVDVVLMDVETPVMDGLTCSRRIRAVEAEGRGGGRRLPIIAVTANVRQEQKETAFAAGVDSVLSKPFTVGEVLARIEEVLGSL
ncbi:hypothetical protein LTR91_008857 [Friedmanniomyces endolithicus]|uniref:histidine kinase n=1 Tax=Friedmanniomyces endolithicus TaxID=329885 RepID=A0AAN6KMA8_9PEZI|nr:hypothetical protein LTR94_002873 [Friedmanniomyces endolithicus]KAK0789018.1 hypothetical protein LTR75_012429 [Friedmanniomyces endolithicus]KAK0801599.1 hypothetical protein LTR59_005312 [Friedmanniomyces endolithicus]KAK0807326.1 hypothetical protein LTR38_004872 [Friedmanniomyces endolithicus]KAK0868216.1 hypothetical protein LTS02_003737 [Friedmanniomyces endolithicus]